MRVSANRARLSRVSSFAKLSQTKLSQAIIAVDAARRARDVAPSDVAIFNARAYAAAQLWLDCREDENPPSMDLCALIYGETRNAVSGMVYRIRKRQREAEAPDPPPPLADVLQA